MKNVIIIVIATLTCFMIWRFIVKDTRKADFVNFFEMRPKLGYVWKDKADTYPKYFWQNTDVIWVPGKLHPTENIFASEIESNWKLLPGYAWVNSTGLETFWKQGLLHPNYNAYSSEKEGIWYPALGYQFYGISFNIFSKGEVYPYLETKRLSNAKIEWTSNLSYAELKVISGLEKDTWEAFPGYTFADPKNSIKVKWTPGLVNPVDSSIASNIEGSWISKSEYSNLNQNNDKNQDNPFKNATIGYGISWLAEKIFGPNFVSRDLNQISGKELIRGFTN